MAQLMSFTPDTFYDSTLTPDQRKPVSICSVYPKAVYITHGATTIAVPACEDGMKVAKSSPVGPGRDIRDYGNDQKVVLECVSSRDNAMDALHLARERVTSRGDKIAAVTTSEWFERGFFVPEGDEPTDREIAAARSRLHKWAQAWLQKGDELFAIEQKAGRVDFQSKLAARILKVRRGWSEGMVEAQQQATIPCPSCRLPIIDGATKCPTCGDRFVYVDGKPILKSDAALHVERESATPPTPPPQQRR